MHNCRVTYPPSWWETELPNGSARALVMRKLRLSLRKYFRTLGKLHPEQYTSNNLYALPINVTLQIQREDKEIWRDISPRVLPPFGKGSRTCGTCSKGWEVLVIRHTFNLYVDNNVFYAFQTKGADYMKLGPSHIDLCHDSVLDPLVVLFPLAIIMCLYISIGIVCDIMRKVKVKTDWLYQYFVYWSTIII